MIDFGWYVVRMDSHGFTEMERSEVFFYEEEAEMTAEQMRQDHPSGIVSIRRK